MKKLVIFIAALVLFAACGGAAEYPARLVRGRTGMILEIDGKRITFVHGSPLNHLKGYTYEDSELALYDDPEVLILDEATSAVDNDTEAAIMESINQFQGRKTLLIIAHRLQTIEKCDYVYRVQGGKVVQER